MVRVRRCWVVWFAVVVVVAVAVAVAIALSIVWGRSTTTCDDARGAWVCWKRPWSERWT